MKPSELAQQLRIGNLIVINNDTYPAFKNVPLSITGIQRRTEELSPKSKYIIDLYDAQGKVSFSQFDEYVEPIPLDAEWLERFGAKQEIWKLADGVTERYWLFENENMPLLTDNLQIDGKDNVPVKFVHQLQNLFFCLVGQDLELK